jgi:tetratricopeptide (TPR) repeat protein
VYLNQSARGMRDVEEGTRLAREAANHALAIEPDDAAAESSLAWIANAYDRDLPAAVRHMERALAHDPGNATVLLNGALMARSLGRLELAEELIRREIANDVANPNPYGQLGKVLSFQGRDEEAIASFRKNIEIAPGYNGVRHWLSLVLLNQGHVRANAEEVLKLAADEPSESYRLGMLAMAYHALGRKAESDAALAQLSPKYDSGASYNIAYVHTFRGEPDLAFAALDKADRNVDGGLVELISQPLFAPLHGDPRWLPLLRKLGRAPEQLAGIPFNVTLPKQVAAP